MASNSSDISLAVPSPSPRLLELRGGGGGGDGEGGLSGVAQITISVTVSSVVLVTVMVILVVAVLKLTQFIRTSQKFKNFIADASKAEFSREDGNPLYLPDHTPVKLPTHITDGNLDIKIPQYSSSLKHKVGLRSPVVAPTSDTLVDVPRDQSGSSATQQQNGTGPQEELHNQYNVLPRMEWDHNATQNGIGPQETGTKPHTAVMIEGTNDSLTSCGMETSEHENGTRV